MVSSKSRTVRSLQFNLMIIAGGMDDRCIMRISYISMHYTECLDGYFVYAISRTARFGVCSDGSFLVHFWCISGLFLVCFWFISGLFLVDFWFISGLFLALR